jgi:hypothetical protein
MIGARRDQVGTRSDPKEDQKIKKDQKRRCPREDNMIDGYMVPVLGFGVLAAVWIVVIWGSTYFGPRDLG